ncbi:hypothetical protein [Fictibacillus fluitans]|uniref:Exo-alpha-sialidase n=1 Tax=Fictibacillus fluitans TaxID=3058422 RepID=A0ABT8HTV1_9BACL|nr:hypothetical protein [Fictibacillus sp. NE201]MDN4524204.1 hypothetical protein [Fictibacillus sp. NE201]
MANHLNRSNSCICRFIRSLKPGELITIFFRDSSASSYGAFISYNAKNDVVTIGVLNGGGIQRFRCQDVSFVQLGEQPPQPGPTPFTCGALSCLWVEDPNDPIYIPPANSAYYETVRYDASAFNGTDPSAFYKMWYDTGSSPSIALATSPDGKNWVPSNDTVRGLISTARHSRILYDPNGFGIGYQYRIWYWNSNFREYSSCPALPNNQVCLIRTAVSNDGITWLDESNISPYKDQPIKQDSENPLFLTGSAANGSFGPADILYYPENPPVLDVANPFNNRYVMYYSIRATPSPPLSTAFEQIALAVSTDGITWSSYGFNPITGPQIILPRGATDADWDLRYASVGMVVVQLGPNNFKMWYSGGHDRSQEGIGCASSTDGIHWTKYAGNPVLSFRDNVAWRNWRTYNPWVLVNPERFNGHGDPVCSKLWFSGQQGNDNNPLRIGYALNANEDSPV